MSLDSFEQFLLGFLGFCAVAAVFLFLGLTIVLNILWHDDPARHAERDARE